MLTLRPYQNEAIDRTGSLIRSGRRRILVVAPTGAGKTVIGARVIEGADAKGNVCLFLAHRRELIAQTYGKVLDAGLPPEKVGVIMGDGRIRHNGRLVNATNPRASVQIASVDTLRNRRRPRAQIVIVDEAHRSNAAGYQTILEDYPDAVVIGLTATPYRLDGRPMGDVYQELVLVAKPSELIAQGHLVAPEIWTHPDVPDVTQLRVDARTHDYRASDLDELYSEPRVVGSTLDHWQKRAKGRLTVLFAPSVKSSQRFAALFASAGIPAEHLDGATPTSERDAILARLGRGETRVVSNVGVLCEGWDQPAVKCCILAAPTQSTGLFLQRAGRILRPWQDVGALILDHAGDVVRHGRPQDDRDFSLAGEVRGLPSPWTCPRCFAVNPHAAACCPHCGAARPSRAPSAPPGPRKGPEEVAGELQRVEEAVVRESRRRWYVEKLQEAVAKGRKVGWARHAFQARFGAWPQYYALERRIYAPQEEPGPAPPPGDPVVPEPSDAEPWEEVCL